MPTRPLTPAQLVEAVRVYRECGENAAAAGKVLGIYRSTMVNRLKHAEAIGLMRKEPEVVKEYRSHCVIPDCQVRDGVPLEHLAWAGRYIAEKKPDVIVCIGDFADLPSLSSYDVGKRAAENKRYKYDLDAAHKAMELLMSPIVTEKDYNPRLVLT